MPNDIKSEEKFYDKGVRDGLVWGLAIGFLIGTVVAYFVPRVF